MIAYGPGTKTAVGQNVCEATVCAFAIHTTLLSVRRVSLACRYRDGINRCLQDARFRGPRTVGMKMTLSAKNALGRKRYQELGTFSQFCPTCSLCVTGPAVQGRERPCCFAGIPGRSLMSAVMPARLWNRCIESHPGSFASAPTQIAIVGDIIHGYV